MAHIENKETLCWTCKNAAPDDKGLYGCSWSIGLKPVKGWNATYVKRKSAEDTYHVISCPEYIPD